MQRRGGGGKQAPVAEKIHIQHGALVSGASHYLDEALRLGPRQGWLDKGWFGDENPHCPAAISSK